MYKVEIIKTVGSCENSLIQKMLEKGDIKFLKLENCKNMEINVKGYASYKGTFENKTNTYFLLHCEHGFIRTASETFIKSFNDYISDVQRFFIREIPCSQGVTYKCEPII